MTKTFCDLCGKEIESPAITLTINLHKETDGKGMIVIPPIASPGWKQFDICEDCKDRAIDFFQAEAGRTSRWRVRFRY